MSNQLDDFFKQKLQNRSFQYDDAYWESAKLLIEADEKRNKRKKIFYLLSGVLFIGLISVGAYYLGKSSNQQDVPNSSIIASTKEDMQRNHTNNQNISIDVEQPSDLVERDKDSVAESSKLLETKYNEDQQNTNKFASNRFSQNDLNKNINIGINTNKDKLKTTDSGSSAITATNYNPNQPKTKGSKEQKESPETVTFLKALSLLPTLNSTLSNVESKLEHKKLLDLPKPDLDNRFGDNKSNFVLGINAAAYMQDIKLSGYHVGISVGYKLNRNLLLRLQPNYSVQFMPTNTFAEGEVDQFSFGLRTSSYKLEAKSMNHIKIPLVLSYKFGKEDLSLFNPVKNRYRKNQISAGFAYVYLDGVKGETTSTVPEGSFTFEKGWIQKSNFSTNKFEFILAYDRFVTKNLSIGLYMHYALSEQFNAAFAANHPSVKAPERLYFGLQTNWRLF